MEVYSVLIGSVGVSFLLLAFFLNIFNIVVKTDKIYIVMNILGASLSCYASVLINFIPFAVLEGVWFIVAVAALIRILIISK